MNILTAVYNRDHFESCTPFPKGKLEPVQLCKQEFTCKFCPHEEKLNNLCVKGKK